MFKFNFSSDASAQDSNTEADIIRSDVKWDEAKRLDLKIDSTTTSSFDISALRLMNFGGIIVKLLKRETALVNIKKDVNSPQCASDAEHDNSDLQPAKYEGGLKVWECSEDLGDYVVKHLGNKEISGKNVLDLGCGAGLIGILALHLGANSVTFQDYNQEVINHWTQPNISLNRDNDDTNKWSCNFWSGDWGSFSDKCTDKFDLIFTSETIYNSNNYGKLSQIFQRNTKPDSIVYLAAKSVYFGLGGSVELFFSEINKDKETFVWKHVFKSDQGVQRVIVTIERKVNSNT